MAADLAGLSIIDTTAQASAADALRHQALHDPLTTLPNRTLLLDRLGHAVESANRDDRSVALLLLDLDQFKEINDTLGHESGDLVLMEVGRRLRGAVRASDTVARLGGDEFAVLMTDDVSPRSTLRAAQRVLSSVLDTIEIDDMSLNVGASLGVAIYPDHADSPGALRRHADIAMYSAKRRGGGLEVYDPDARVHSYDRLTMVGQLNRALAAGELELWYQPMVDLSDGSISRIEALVRWNHPDRGLLGAEQFVDTAEVSGLIRPLNRWMVEQALKDLAGLHARGHDLQVAVNMSVRNLDERSFVDSVFAVLDRTGVSGSRLVLELNEAQVMGDPLLTSAVLNRLADRQVVGSVEGFGTGHTSLQDLQRLPVRELKIDRSFVHAMVDGGESAAKIVTALVSLGRTLGLGVCADGVLDDTTLTRLALLHCDRAQGPHLWRPMPLQELVEQLSARAAVVPSE